MKLWTRYYKQRIEAKVPEYKEIRGTSLLQLQTEDSELAARTSDTVTLGGTAAGTVTSARARVSSCDTNLWCLEIQRFQVVSRLDHAWSKIYKSRTFKAWTNSSLIAYLTSLFIATVATEAVRTLQPVEQCRPLSEGVLPERVRRKKGEKSKSQLRISWTF